MSVCPKTPNIGYCEAFYAEARTERCLKI